MIFGISVRDTDAILNVDHYEAFTLLVLYRHGFGGEPKKRLTRTQFNDHIASYGIDPDDPGFRQASRSLRRKKALSRGALPSVELNLNGTMLAYALGKSCGDFPVGHPLPTIEALAATLRYAESHIVYADSSISGGILLTEMNTLATASLLKNAPEFAALLPEGRISDELQEESLEGLLGLGLLFMYDGHVYGIRPGGPSAHDEEPE